MSSGSNFEVTPISVILPSVLVMLIWVVYWIEVRFFINLTFLGVHPRSFKGLAGVLFSPFIHGDISHLWSNTLPLLILSFSLLYVYGKPAISNLLYGWVTTGLLTWFIAQDGWHIGASGVIYFIAFFLFFNGIRDQNYRSVALSFLVVFLYGSLVWYVMPIKQGMSWEGHLSGAITGLIFSYALPLKLNQSPKYIWENPEYEEHNDAFMRHFDENGDWLDLKEEE